MHFLPNVYVTCEQCKGRRYNRETLGSNTAASRSPTCSISPSTRPCRCSRTSRRLRQAADAAERRPGLHHASAVGDDVGGGEAQRVKLSRELSKRGTGRTLYILDSPPRPPFRGREKLLDVLMRLVEQGNTIVVIEHNLDVIKSADWLIDSVLRAAGAAGRSCAGTPEQVAKARVRRPASS